MSPNSPATGAAPDADTDALPPTGKKRGAHPSPSDKQARNTGAEGLEVFFEHGRWRHFGWMCFGALTGAVLVTQLGTVGQGLGFILAAVAAFNAFGFAKTLLKPAGRIVIGTDTVILADGLCHGTENWLDREAIRHSYFLRRAAPWLRSGPMLVIETADRAFVYPRDWFGSEADQRRIAEALQHDDRSAAAKLKNKAAKEAAKVASDAKSTAAKASHLDAESADGPGKRKPGK